MRKNVSISRAYSKKAMKRGSADGIFWYGFTFPRAQGFHFFKLASNLNHLASNVFCGAFEYHGYDCQSNQISGKKPIQSVLSREDAYWTKWYALKANIYGIVLTENERNILMQKSKAQETEECSLFDPRFYFSKDYDAANWYFNWIFDFEL
jgi:hypothetical protein